jgi:hypothetical protein
LARTGTLNDCGYSVCRESCYGLLRCVLPLSWSAPTARSGDTGRRTAARLEGEPASRKSASAARPLPGHAPERTPLDAGR